MVSRNWRQDRGAKWVIRHRSGWLVIPIQHICLIVYPRGQHTPARLNKTIPRVDQHLDRYFYAHRRTYRGTLTLKRKIINKYQSKATLLPYSLRLHCQMIQRHAIISISQQLSPTAVDSYAVASPLQHPAAKSATLHRRTDDIVYGSGVQFSFCVGAEVARHAIVEDGEAGGNNLLDPIHNRILFLYLCLEWLLEVLLSHF
eukprot:gene9415-6613_t